MITDADVESLKTTMGSVKDFQAAEESELENETIENKSYNTSNSDRSGAKKLYRDSKRKLLGGVAAGLAHYFGIAPSHSQLLPSSRSGSRSLR